MAQAKPVLLVFLVVVSVAVNMSAAQAVCRTVPTAGGTAAPEPCAFPFTFRGLTFSTCTDVADPNNEMWCSVEVDADGKHVGNKGRWGHCNPAECREAMTPPSEPTPPPTPATRPTSRTPTRPPRRPSRPTSPPASARPTSPSTRPPRPTTPPTSRTRPTSPTVELPETTADPDRRPVNRPLFPVEPPVIVEIRPPFAQDSSVGSTSINSKGEKCRTVAGEECVFPFKFRGTHSDCTMDDADSADGAWCSTLVDRNGFHMKGHYGVCRCAEPDEEEEAEVAAPAAVAPPPTALTTECHPSNSSSSDFTLEGNFLPPFFGGECGFPGPAAVAFSSAGFGKNSMGPPVAAALQEFPFAARVSGCAGTLINRRYVLTAASCAARGGTGGLEVVLGDLDLGRECDCAAGPGGNTACSDLPQKIAVEKWTAHPGWLRGRTADDLALARLAEPANVTASVSPVCLPADPDFVAAAVGASDLSAGLVGKPVVAVGWKGANIRTLRKETLRVSVCRRRNVAGRRAFCATAARCTGGVSDAGGAAVVDVGGTDGGGSNLPRYSLVGVAASAGCPATTFARVSDYIDWIRDNMEP